MVLNRRDLGALLGALLFMAALAALLFVFFGYWWPLLPAWIAVPITVLVAVGAIGSPIYTLMKVSDRMLQRQQREQRQGQGSTADNARPISPSKRGPR